jgi:hypothetical protein
VAATGTTAPGTTTGPAESTRDPQTPDRQRRYLKLYYFYNSKSDYLLIA